MAGAAGIRAGRAYIELGVAADKLNKGLDAAASKLNQWSATAQSNLASAFVVAAPVALAVKTFSDFDDQMRLTQAVSGATGAQFEALTAKAKELGRTTSWTAAQVAEGMVGLGRAGFKTDEIDASIGSVMDLARATGTDIALATDIAGAALRAFNMDASEMNRVCDVLTATANGSAQTLEDLGEAFKYVAPIAAQTGATVEDTAKIVGALANFGVKGSQAGTVFKAIQLRMASDENAQAKYSELGIDTTDAQGNLRAVGDVLAELGQKIQTMPNAERLATIKTLFGQYGITGVAITAANFEALNRSIDNANGTASRTAAAMDGGLGGVIRITQSAIEGFGLALGEALTPTLESAAGKIQAAAAWLTEFAKTSGSTISNVAKAGAAFAALNVAALLVSKSVGAVVSIAKVATSVYNGMTRAIDLVVGATRAARAADLAQAATQKALVEVKTAVIAVEKAKTAAEAQAAQASLVLATANYKSAAAAEAQAVATAASSAKIVAATVAYTAAIAVVAALAFAFYSYASAADRAATAAGKAAQQAKEFATANAQQREQDQSLLAQLVELANKQQLTNEEFARGQNIVDELQKRYGDLGLKADAASRSILGAANAQARLNAAQREQELRDLKNQIETNNEEDARVRAAQKRLNNNWATGVTAGVKQLLGGKSISEQNQEYNDRSAEIRRNNASLEARIKAIENEQRGAALDVAQGVTPAPAYGQQPIDVKIPEVDPAIESAQPIATSIESSLASFLDRVELPTIGEEIQQAAIDVANQTETTGATTNAVEALDVANNWQRDELKRQTNELADQTNELKRLNKTFADALANNDGEFI